ncbi:RNA binding protein, heterogenous nuclear RNP-K like protein [Coemansia sp. RSA 552]|nr:RNA binding protein, heterogenous nuclear RNP-K like protein [Coemansia sp. RSA 552]
MSEGPKRFSLSDYQSKRGHTRPAEATATNDQKSELEELHLLLGTAASAIGMDSGSEIPEVLRTPGASPDNRDSKESRHGRRRSRDRGRSSNRRHHHRRRRSNSPPSRSRSESRHRHRPRVRSPSHSRSRARSHSRPRARSRSRARSHSRSRTRHRRRRHSRSRSSSADKISVRCIFPYEDGGIIIGLRGAHLTKLRSAMPSVEWRISNETSDRQDRILVIKGSVKHVSEAFRELAEHFISQGMHVDYPPQVRGRGSKDVDTSKPFVPIRLLIPHKTCGAIIGQKSETLINTRISCAARRVYVYRERIAESRERVVEIVGTPRSVARVMRVLGEQVARTLTSDQMESDPYVPERDGLRKFLGKQGVPRTRVCLESIKGAETEEAADQSTEPSRSEAQTDGSRKRSRSYTRSMSRSPSSERSPSRSHSRDKARHRRRSHRRHRRRERSRSLSNERSRSTHSEKRHDSNSSRRERGKRHASRHGSRRHRSRKDSASRSPSASRSRSRDGRDSRKKKERRSRGPGHDDAAKSAAGANVETAGSPGPAADTNGTGMLHGSVECTAGAVADAAGHGTVSGGSW